MTQLATTSTPAVLSHHHARDVFIADLEDLRKGFLETIDLDVLEPGDEEPSGPLFVNRKARIAHLISVYLCEIVDHLECGGMDRDFYTVIEFAVVVEKSYEKPDQELTAKRHLKFVARAEAFSADNDAQVRFILSNFTPLPNLPNSARLADLCAAATYYGMMAYYYEDQTFEGKVDKASVQEHFGLQLRENTRAMRSSGSEDVEVAPWYPDDSGQWIERKPSKGRPKGLNKGTVIFYLSRAERISQRYIEVTANAKDLDWSEPKGSDDYIVAYRLADQSSEKAPWYPDTSGEWVEVTGKGRPKGLKKSTVVEYLHLGERKNKDFIRVTDKVGDLDWRRAGQGILEHLVIVAYRIVKKD